MKADRKNLRMEERFKRLQLKIIAFFTLIVIVVTVFLAVVILGRSDAIMRQTVSSLTAANCRQLLLNINSYLDKVETTAALLFADEDYYQYDATDSSYADYDRVKKETEISDRLVDLGLMENFADFGIIYADEHTVGWISHTTEGMFPNAGMYDTFAACLTDAASEDGWVFGLEGNMDRMYYVKRLNPNAILLTSYYNRELSSAFKYPDELKDMTLYLVNEDHLILYSSQQTDIGSTLPEDIAVRIRDQSNVTIMDNAYLITANTCENDWQVICAIPTEALLKENFNLRIFVIAFSSALCLIVIAVGLFTIRSFTKPMDGMVTVLENKAERDQLSGLFNKISFQEQVSLLIQDHNPDRILAMIMLDADHFKQINDHLGHAKGDQVIARIGYLLRHQFHTGAIVGRVGGDEFAVYLEFYAVSREQVEQDLGTLLDQLFTSYAHTFAREHEQCGLALSGGVYICPDEEHMDFTTMYHRSDDALYYSKRNGKGRYTFYQEGMTDETS
jgi:diguanylate cyclase (GGDEF)-like protein